MKYPHSDIVDAYQKLALEKGILKKAAENKVETKYSGRNRELTDAEFLYGVKPKEEVFFKKPLWEEAHPSPVVIAPSHDKFNGLVENLQERQNVMIWIAKKPVRGFLANNVYATQQDLLNELLKLGQFLDNENQYQLMNLADSCSSRLSKTAAAPLLIGALIAAGVVALYTIVTQNNNLSQGVSQDASKALTEIQEALDDYSDRPEFAQSLTDLLHKISEIKNIADKVSYIKFEPPTGEHATDAALVLENVQNNKVEASIKLLQKYKNKCQEMTILIPDYVNFMKMKLSQYEETHSDWLEPLRRGFRYLIPTDMEDAWKALLSLQESCLNGLQLIDSQINLLEKVKEKSHQAIQAVVEKPKEESDKPMLSKLNLGTI